MLSSYRGLLGTGTYGHQRSLTPALKTRNVALTAAMALPLSAVLAALCSLHDRLIADIMAYRPPQQPGQSFFLGRGKVR